MTREQEPSPFDEFINQLGIKEDLTDLAPLFGSLVTAQNAFEETGLQEYGRLADMYAEEFLGEFKRIVGRPLLEVDDEK